VDLAIAPGDGPWVRVVEGPVNVPPPIDAATETRLALKEDIGGIFGVFAVPLQPVIAVVVSAGAVVAGLVNVLEAGVAVTLNIAFLGMLLFAEGTRLGRALWYVAFELPTSGLAWLGAVPIFGPVAKLVGLTYVLWFPVVVLAVVAILL